MMPSLSSARNEPEQPEMTTGRRLRRARLRRRWSQQQLVMQMHLVAAGRGGTASNEALKIMVSKWENDRVIPGEFNRRLLAASLGIRVVDLGLSEDPDFVW